MDNKKIGNFIAEMRKANNMTQKDLAEQLNVTDKAVSKWERGMGYPEITTIPSLAKVLNISTSELMLGQKIDSDTGNSSDPEVIVSDTMEFVEQAHRQKTLITKNIIFNSINVSFLIGIFVCVLCNFVIQKRLDWSLYVVGSEIAAWVILAPFFLIKRHRFVGAMAGLTITILPLLFLIEYLCPIKGWVIPFALPMVVISLIGLWISVILFSYTRINRLYLVSFELILFGVVLNIIINSFVSNYLNSYDNLSNFIVELSCGFLAVVLFVYAAIRKNRK
jgi:transcriptional regulator with XRE-family HTH domain